MKGIISEVNSWRYERKFYVSGLSWYEVENIIKTHPAMFREIHYKRTVNNIYFDTFGLKHLHDNINGIETRSKVRIRWYGQLYGLIDKPMLELKFKSNMNVGKLRYQLSPFTLDSQLSLKMIRDVIQESAVDQRVKLNLAFLNFSLLNRYKRKYFLSEDGHYRITIDTDRQVYQIYPLHNSFFLQWENSTDVILELKYDTCHDVFADRITNFFPFRVTRSSKYVDGMVNLYKY